VKVGALCVKNRRCAFWHTFFVVCENYVSELCTL